MVKCPECNKELLDLEKAFINKNSNNNSEYDDYDSAKKLSDIYNDNRRYYCNNCDLGFDESEV